MKKILITLFLGIPCLCWGQERSPQSSNHQLPAIPAIKIDSVRKNITNPFSIKRKYIIDTPSPKFSNIPSTYIDRKRSTSDELINNYNEETIFKIEKSANAILLYTNEEFEYELVISDIGFDSFLLIQQNKHYYSYHSLKEKNKILVAEWNSKCNDNMCQANINNIYENPIDYDNQIFYGFDFEYKLYMFFKFMEKKHGVNINTFVKL